MCLGGDRVRGHAHRVRVRGQCDARLGRRDQTRRHGARCRVLSVRSNDGGGLGKALLRPSNQCNHGVTICEECAATWETDYTVRYWATKGGRTLAARPRRNATRPGGPHRIDARRRAPVGRADSATTPGPVYVHGWPFPPGPVRERAAPAARPVDTPGRLWCVHTPGARSPWGGIGFGVDAAPGHGPVVQWVVLICADSQSSTGPNVSVV